MKVLQPIYYKEFKCIGGACKYSCCIGWDVPINKESFIKYKNNKSEFGKKLKLSIGRNRGKNDDSSYGNMKLQNGRCQMLNDNNLCDIYINLGEESMCDTCKIYPRMINRYSELYERNLTASCPVVIEYLMRKDKLEFEIIDDKISSVEKKYINNIKVNTNLYTFLWDSRSLLIEIAQNREIELWKRLAFIAMAEEKLQQELKENRYNGLENIIEYINNAVNSEEVNNYLDSIPIKQDVKIKFLQSILQIRCNYGLGNENFANILKDFEEFVNDEEIAFNDMLDIEKEFECEMKELDYILENYIVYHIYANFMKALYNKDIHKEIGKLIISYSIIRNLSIAQFYKHKKIDKDMILEILCSFSREIEHSNRFLEIMWSNIQEIGYDSIAYLLILLR